MARDKEVFICSFCQSRPSKCFRCLDCNAYMCIDCERTIHSKVRGSDSHSGIFINNYTKRSVRESRWRKFGLSSLSFLKCCRSGKHHEGERTIIRTLSFSDALLGTNKVRKHQENFNEDHNSKSVTLDEECVYHDEMNYYAKTDREHKQPVKVVAEFQVDLPVINRLVYCSDSSIWLTRATQSSLHCVTTANGYGLQTSTNYDIKAFDIAALSTGDILIASSDSLIKQIKMGEKSIENSKYSIEPFLPTAIHVSLRGKIIIGAMSAGQAFPPNGKRQLMSLGMSGQIEFTVDQISDGKMIKDNFSYLFDITSDNDDFMYILDRLSTNCEGRIVILNQQGFCRALYQGHPVFNIEMKFKPKGIIVTRQGSVIISEAHNHTLHFINSRGDLMQYLNTFDQWSLSFPQSLACDFRNNLLVGTSRRKGSQDKSKLYFIKL